MAGVLDLTVDLGQSPREARADSESRTFAYTVSLSDWPKQKDKQKDKSPKVRGASASTASTSTSTPPSPRGGKSPKTKAYWLPPENPEGPVEYKLKLSDVPPARFEHLVTQLKFRLAESGGEGACTYLLGVEDRGFCRGLPPNDLKATLATLYAMCASLTGVKETVASAEDFLADVAGTLEEEKTTATDLFTMRVVCKEGREGKYCRADIKLIPKQHAYSYTELRVAMCGAHDAGKSTLMSVLTHGEHRKPLLCNGMVSPSAPIRAKSRTPPAPPSHRGGRAVDANLLTLRSSIPFAPAIALPGPSSEPGLHPQARGGERPHLEHRLRVPCVREARDLSELPDHQRLLAPHSGGNVKRGRKNAQTL